MPPIPPFPELGFGENPHGCYVFKVGAVFALREACRNGAAEQNETEKRMRRTLNALTTKLAGRVKPFLNIPTALMMPLAVGGFGLSLWMVEDASMDYTAFAHNYNSINNVTSNDGNMLRAYAGGAIDGQSNHEGEDAVYEEGTLTAAASGYAGASWVMEGNFEGNFAVFIFVETLAVAGNKRDSDDDDLEATLTARLLKVPPHLQHRYGKERYVRDPEPLVECKAGATAEGEDAIVRWNLPFVGEQVDRHSHYSELKAACTVSKDGETLSYARAYTVVSAYPKIYTGTEPWHGF